MKTKRALNQICLAHLAGPAGGDVFTFRQSDLFIKSADLKPLPTGLAVGLAQ